MLVMINIAQLWILAGVTYRYGGYFELLALVMG